MNEIVSLFLSWYVFLLEYMKTTNFRSLSYSSTLLNVFISFRRFLLESLLFFIYFIYWKCAFFSEYGGT